MSLTHVLILIVVGALLAAGDFFMKSWATDGNFRTNIAWYVFAMLVYIAGLSCYGYILKSVDFASASYSILIFNMIFVALVGVFYFKDTLSWYEGCGIVFGLLSIIMFSLSES